MLVYIGAISVLILFAIMLTQTKAAPARLVFQTQAVPAAIAGVILAIADRPAASASTDLARVAARLVASPRTRSPASLFGHSSSPFEVVSVLLLAAVIGGVFLAKREGGRADALRRLSSTPT